MGWSSKWGIFLVSLQPPNKQIQACGPTTNIKIDPGRAPQKPLRNIPRSIGIIVFCFAGRRWNVGFFVRETFGFDQGGASRFPVWVPPIPGTFNKQFFGTYNLLIYRSYNPFTKYHGHPNKVDILSRISLFFSISTHFFKDFSDFPSQLGICLGVIFDGLGSYGMKITIIHHHLSNA